MEFTVKDLLAVLCSYLQQGRPLALATVVRQQGSAPREAGARLLANERGLVHGTVGGGLMEAMTLEACAQALADGKSRTLSLDLSGEMAENADMICGGDMRVLVEPLSPAPCLLELYQTMRRRLDEGGAILIKGLEGAQGLTTFLMDNACLGHQLPAHVLEEARSFLQQVQSCPCVRTFPDSEYYFEPLLPPSRMIVAGGGHVAVATARIASMTGFEVTVLDDREEFASPSRFPFVAHTRVVPNFAHCFTAPAPNIHTFIIIVTRGHVHDATVLAQALATRAGYIGMIGSTHKRDQLYTHMRQLGFGDSDLARVHCPIGLPIDADTPEEIALSIVAQCVSVKRKRRQAR